MKKITKTMRHLGLKAEVCCRRSFFGCSRNNSSLKAGVLVKFLDIKRIHILGIYGSGKSTFALSLSKRLNIRCYDLDEIKYKRKFDKIRSLKERLKIIRNISRKTSWITEGAWTSYAAPVYRNADLVVFLKIPEPRIYWRILKRYIRRRSDSTKYEKDTILTTLCIMRQVFRYFHKPKSFMTLQSHKECIDTYAKKYILLRNQKEINAFLDKVR